LRPRSWSREHLRPVLCGLRLGLGLDRPTCGLGLGLGIEGLVSNIFRDQCVYLAIYLLRLFMSEPAPYEEVRHSCSPVLTLFVFYTLCIRHLCVVRCTRTWSWHLHHQMPLLRRSLAMTSSSPCVDSWAPCTVFLDQPHWRENLQPWKHWTYRACVDGRPVYTSRVLTARVDG